MTTTTTTRTPGLQITLAYYLGIAADALWAVGLFIPSVFAALTGDATFAEDCTVQLRSVMSMAGIIMSAWTILLVWAVQSPIERRVVILITSGIVFGMFVLALVDVVWRGNMFQIWILVKTIVLFGSMVLSYILSERIARKEKLT